MSTSFAFEPERNMSYCIPVVSSFVFAHSCGILNAVPAGMSSEHDSLPRLVYYGRWISIECKYKQAQRVVKNIR